jgi:hypothetical protein
MTPMDLSVILTLVLTSAAVSAAVSGLFGFVSQHLDRQAREREFKMKTAAAERELVMKGAIDWATKTWEQSRELTKLGNRVDTPALGWLAHDYHQQLGSLLKDGTLPPEVQQAYDAWLQQTPRSPAGTPSDGRL